MVFSETVELIDNPAVASELNSEIISDPEAFAGLEREWNRVLEQTGIDYPFLTHQWVFTWWECYGAAENKLHIILVREGDEIIAIAPLMLTRRKFYGVPLRCLEFIANVHTPRFDFIATRREAEVYRVLWSSLMRQRKHWDVMLLRQVPENSRTLATIPQLAEKENLRWGRWRSADSPYLPIQDDWDNYFRKLHSKHRANIRRRLKRLMEFGPVEMERVVSESELENALQDGFRLEGAAWKAQNGTSISAQAESLLFYTKLAERFASQRWLHLCFLTLAGRRIAFHYSVVYKHKVYLLKPGYDPEYASCSPVNLLCSSSLQEAFGQGLSEFDFLGIDDEWKLQWTRKTRTHDWIFVFSKAPLAYLVYLVKFRLLPTLQKKRICRALYNWVVGLRRSAATAKDGL
ncbi:MAG: GNAT family N-acetyltransferase [Acidobacteria bacterium]|nr:GNAT family N-acetyltransferase [Acidobacteriota bacterium]